MLKVLDRRKGRIVAASQASSPITCLACKDDGLYVALGTQGGVAQLYDPRKLAHSLLKFSCPGEGAVRDLHWQHTSAGKVGGRKPQPIPGERPASSLNASTSSSAAGWGSGVPSGSESPGMTSSLSSPAPTLVAQPNHRADEGEATDLIGSTAAIWGSHAGSVVDTPAQPRMRSNRGQPARQASGAPPAHRAAPLTTPSHQGVESSMAIFSPYSAMPAQPGQDASRPAVPTGGDRWHGKDPTHSQQTQDPNLLPASAALPPRMRSSASRDMDDSEHNRDSGRSSQPIHSISSTSSRDHTRDSGRSTQAVHSMSSTSSRDVASDGDAPRRRRARDPASQQLPQQQPGWELTRGVGSQSNSGEGPAGPPVQPATPRQEGGHRKMDSDGSEPPSRLKPGRIEDNMATFSFTSPADRSPQPSSHPITAPSQRQVPPGQLEQLPQQQSAAAAAADLQETDQGGNLLLENPELPPAYMPYAPAEDGEDVPFPQTPEQTLAAQLQVQLAVEDGIAGLRDDIRSLHLDVLRNSQIQQLEMSSAMESMQVQQDGLAQQVRELQEQIQTLLKSRDAALWL
ncbi:hypothetical protein WJX84_001761 [Apatococcus fuscideae]|uniref:Uncharacterized protein n=1 Tax=Apatococcus fuscideae TaxID=2026836 RepID=A0AAW1T5Q1_9CHLO